MNALFVGRFQPFHKGHLKVVTELSTKFDNVIICIGSAQFSHTIENPFTAGERYEMITKSLNRVNISNFVAVPVEDINRHSLWVKHVCSIVPHFDVVYTNEPLSIRLFSEENYNVERIRWYNRRLYSGTEIRKRMINDKKWEHLVPKVVVDIITKVDGVNRIKDIAKCR
jgi:nicotinamide-nucleotide adenylyltransferase